MQLSKRLAEIYGLIENCKKFADVGCDHGYIARMVLLGGKAERVVISDVSAKSLEKAVRLIGNDGRVQAVVCDGLEKIPADCDQILIAGMGGEEIISILDAAPFTPPRLVLQPMKNADKVRKRLLSGGYRIEKDYIIKDGKFYALIAAARGEDQYTEEELYFGRDNLKAPSEDFLEFARCEIARLREVEKRNLPPVAAEKINKLIIGYGGFLK